MLHRPWGCAVQPDFRSAALADAELQPMPLIDRRGCFGRNGDDQCTACILRVSPKDYTGRFPALAVIAPDLRVHLLKRPDGTPYTELFCRDRRTASTHAPDASVSKELAAVCVVEHHSASIADLGKTRESADCGGVVASSSAAAGLGC